jgi:hypothetical protein
MAIGEVILACFTDYIGLVACEEVTPGSGLFINSLPGISNDVLQAITDPQDETYIVTWNAIQFRAILAFRSRLLKEINKCLNINKLDTIECLACENKEVLALSLQYLLGSFCMTQALYNWNNSKFSTVDKQSVEDIRDYYAAEFDKELAAAVKGIDVLESDCIALDKQCRISPNGRISTQESRM